MQVMNILHPELGAEAVVGATLFSLLLYPDEGEAEKRAAFCAALVAGCVAREPDLERRAEQMARLPGPIDLDPAAIKAGLKGSRRRARNRLLAGWMLLQRLGVGVRSPGAPAPTRRPSIKALAERILRWAGDSNVDNVVNRLWSPSRPVLHLAAALQVLASESGVEEGQWADVTLDDPRLNERIVTMAGEIEEKVLADASLSSWSAGLIRINLVKIAD